ncbi:MAG: DUF6531 domain-containing protein, partial [Woeseiaceae bacterium]|nr:DUF6531 domain-containing protein [Woeseiaceae bacterium]
MLGIRCSLSAAAIVILFTVALVPTPASSQIDCRVDENVPCDDFNWDSLIPTSVLDGLEELKAALDYAVAFPDPLDTGVPPDPAIVSVDPQRGVEIAGNNHGTALCGNPINLATGNKYQREVDFVGGGTFPLSIIRHYNSDGAETAASDGVFGQGWNNQLADRIVRKFSVEVSGTEHQLVTIERQSGQRIGLTKVGDGRWTRGSGKVEAFGYHEDMHVWFWYDEGLLKTFYGEGRPLVYYHPSGESQKFVHEEYSPETYRIREVQHSSGRKLIVNYDAQDRIGSIVDPGNRTYQYFYDTNGNLHQVDAPDVAGTMRKDYYYEDPNYPSALTGIGFDGQPQRFATFAYDSQGRAITSEHSVGVEKLTVNYIAESPNVRRSTTNVHGKVTDYTFDELEDTQRVTDVNGQPHGTCVATDTSYTYDSRGYYDEITDAEGHVTKLVHDDFGFRERATSGFGSSSPRETEYYFDIFWQQPRRIENDLLRSDFDYNVDGELLSVTMTNKSQYGIPNQQRIWTFDYEKYSNKIRKKVTVDGPRTDVDDITTYHYDTSGRLSSIDQQVTASLSLVTTIDTYDAYGRPTKITFP